ncbi:MAG: CDP-alcohol phosphatidyltransferase family protein [Bacteroidales bacterium]|nr:CDP-alcohol phosphatidyltransferase family protein [Bacteroidales bacterium]
MGKIEQATRIQTSVLSAAEKKALVWLAARQPKWVTSDFMTGLGMVGSVLIFAGFVLSNLGMQWLWVAIAGLILNWYGDSLDGTLARVRHAQRPVYGYFLDHTMDIANELLMFIGVGLSPLVHLHVALMALVFYLILTVMQNINAHLRQEFNLTYAKLGPTELRLFVILICLLFIFVKPISEYRHTIHVLGNVYTATIFDYVAVFVVVALAAISLGYFIKDLKYYAKIDPPKYKPE